jgi:hypothetical protein
MIETADLLTISLGFIGVLAGLTFAGAIQPVVMWADRSRQFDEGIAALAGAFENIRAALVTKKECDILPLTVAVAGLAPWGGSPRLRAAYVSALSKQTSSEKRASAVLLAYVKAWLDEIKGPTYANDASKRWPSFQRLNATVVLADILSDPANSGLISDDMRHHLDAKTINDLFVQVRSTSSHASTANVLWIVMFFTFLVSAFLTESGVALFENAIRHDSVTSDTTMFIKISYYGLVLTLAAAEFVAYGVLYWRACARLTAGEFTNDRGLAIAVCDPGRYRIVPAISNLVLALAYLGLVACLDELFSYY